MKKCLLLFLLLCIGLYANSQTQDTIQKYISFNTAIISSAGPLDENISNTLEFGKQWDGVFSLGISFGQISKDLYNEIRPNLNVFQVGRFVNTFTPGLGYIYHSNMPVLIEFTTGIEYSWTNTIHLNIQFGQYYFSGKSNQNSNVFIGLSIAKFFNNYKQNALLSR